MEAGEEPQVTSLRSYAAKRQHKPFRGQVCWVCTIPERKEIDENHGHVTRQFIVEWLIDTGYSEKEATKARINYHFQSGHHLKGKK